MQAKPKLTKLEWLEIALLIAPFLYLAAEWDKFPARIPIHWNIHGKIDGWASKSFGLFLLPVTNLFVWILLRFLPQIDPKVRRSSDDDRSRAMAVLRIVRVVTLIFMSGMFWVQTAISLGYPISMNAFALNGCLIVFIVIGNYFSNLRPNYFAGIRTPWTLDNAETWRATHRAGGRIMVFGSLLLIAAEFFVGRQMFAYLVVAFLLGFTLSAFLYSWNHFRTHAATLSEPFTLAKDARKFRAGLTRWFGKNGRDLPWRRTRDPYAIWISEIMLQQTQVVTVIDYFERWMKRFPSVKELAEAPEDDVLHVWQGLGYYSRARNLHRAAQFVVQSHGGKIPASPDEIRKLPGIGRYTAGAIATFAFDASTPIVDANIARVLARLLDLRTPVDSTAGQAIIWGQAEALQPEKKAGIYNSALMELGALVCLPRSPKCPVCPVREFCRATAPESLPVKKPARKRVELAENCAWIVKGGRILLEQQMGTRWRGLWKLPLMRGAAAGHLLQLTYPFTHHRVTLSVFPQAAPGVAASLAPLQRWFKIKDLDQVAITAPHRRAIEKLLA